MSRIIDKLDLCKIVFNSIESLNKTIFRNEKKFHIIMPLVNK